MAWTDLTDVLRSFSCRRGRATPLSRIEAGTASFEFNNGSGDLDPANPGGVINLVKNPSFETDILTWTGGVAVISRVTTEALFGSASMKAISTAATGGLATIDLADAPAATAGQTITGSCWIKGTAGKLVSPRIAGFNSSDTITTDAYTGDSVVLTGAWQRITITRTLADATTVKARFHPQSDQSEILTFYIDGVQMEFASTASEYVDGDQARGRWDGTAHASQTYSAPYYGSILPLKEIVLSRIEGGLPYNRFRGPIERYEPTWAPPHHQFMTIDVADGFETLANVKLVSGFSALTTTLTGSNNDLTFTAARAGGQGDDITITYVVAGTGTALTVETNDPLDGGAVVVSSPLPVQQPGFLGLFGGFLGSQAPTAAPDQQPVSLQVQGTDITVNVATNGGGAATSTASQILAAIEASPDASALVTVALAPGSDGSGVVTAMAQTNLSGGKWDQETTGERITRVLDEAEWPDDRRELDTGLFEVVAQGFSEADNVSALTHMQDVADSELGYVFIDGSGTFHFHAGDHRGTAEGSTTLQATFADDGNGFPYVALNYNLGKDTIYNVVTVTAGAQGAIAQTAEDTDSSAQPPTGYGPRAFSKSTLLAIDADALSVANVILSAFANPRTRFESITVLMPSSDTNDWVEAVFGLEIGDLVRVRTSPPVAETATGYTISYDCFVEAIEDTYSPGTPWQVTFQLTPFTEALTPELPPEDTGAMEDSSGDDLVLDDAAEGVLG
jgi:hypothetical protein